ncbi:MAG: hypothetical protein ACR2OZ_00825 [Verrucomicrobiales bacterium]
MNQPIFHPQPHSKVEVVAMRLLFALVVWDFIPWRLPQTELDRPVGLAGMGMDLGFLANPAVLVPVNWVAVVLLCLYVAGPWRWLTTTLLFALTVLLGTYANSTGDLKHHHQIVSLILLAQTLWHLYNLIRHRVSKDETGSGRWEAFVSQQAIVVAYIVTGITKLKTSGVGWISVASNYGPVHLREANRSAYYGTLETSTDAGTAVEKLMIEHPYAARAMLAGGLFLELLAVLALLGRTWSFVYGCLLVLFHTLNSVVMNLNFRWHNEVVAIFLIMPPALAFLQHWSEKRTRQQQRSVEHRPRKVQPRHQNPGREE